MRWFSLLLLVTTGCIPEMGGAGDDDAGPDGSTDARVLVDATGSDEPDVPDDPAEYPPDDPNDDPDDDPPPPVAPPRCDDGRDNDGDGRIDLAPGRTPRRRGATRTWRWSRWARTAASSSWPPTDSDG